MPKAAMYALVWFPERGMYELRNQRTGESHLVHEDDGRWVGRLAGHASFAFQGQDGRLNLLKEARPSGGDGYLVRLPPSGRAHGQEIRRSHRRSDHCAPRSDGARPRERGAART